MSKEDKHICRASDKELVLDSSYNAVIIYVFIGLFSIGHGVRLLPDTTSLGSIEQILEVIEGLIKYYFSSEAKAT
jgi:hypothetical protein